ncbi:MAG: hypothetical protein ACK4RK_13990 [Gemmataceae bacterium]
MRFAPFRKWFILLFGLVPALLLLSKSDSAGPQVRAEPCYFPESCHGPCYTLRDLRRMSNAQLDCLFTQAPLGSLPVGKVRGHIINLQGRRIPIVAEVASMVSWRGKQFQPNGCFVNRFTGGIRAVRSCATIKDSWYDSKPCYSLEYREGTPFFGNVRDEVRELCPGSYLGRAYEVHSRKHLGYILMDFKPGKPMVRSFPCDEPDCAADALDGPDQDCLHD